MIFDTIENAHLYKALSKNLAKGLDFIQNTNLLELQPGKYEIDGSNVFASVSNYETKNLVDGKFEAHKQYIDIQILTSGEEKIYYAPLKETKEKEPYNEAKDIVFLNGSGDFVTIASGTFVIFFPTDAHMPGILAEKKTLVNKIVIKVRV